jgi:hypothetical protein
VQNWSISNYPRFYVQNWRAEERATVLLFVAGAHHSSKAMCRPLDDRVREPPLDPWALRTDRDGPVPPNMPAKTMNYAPHVNLI